METKFFSKSSRRNRILAIQRAWPEKPGSTLQRVGPCRVQFSQAGDRARVVLHRIFSNFLDFDPNQASPVVDSYLALQERDLTFAAVPTDTLEFVEQRLRFPPGLAPKQLPARVSGVRDAGQPPSHPDLRVMLDRDLALLQGRVQTHPTGAGASRLYKHGGLSLMESLVPWLALKS